MINEVKLQGFRGAAGHIRCFAHILNLSVKVLCTLSKREPVLTCVTLKAILSQFANKLDVNGPAPRRARVSRKRKKGAHRARKRTAPSASTHGPTRTQTQAANHRSDDSESSDGDNNRGNDGGSHNGSGIRNGNSDGDSGSDDEGANDDIEPTDGVDQDEDVIRAAEAAQQEDLDEAVQSAELEVTVAGCEQMAASTALSKVSLAFILPKHIC